MQLKQKNFLFLSSITIISLFIFFVFIKPQINYYHQHYVKIHGIFFLKPIDPGKFALIDHANRQFTQDNLKNHWTFLFFGFTHCNLVCPVTLTALNKTYQILEPKLPKNDLPQIIFVSIDPQGDSLERLKKYVTHFNQNFIGTKTSAEKTKELEKLFHIVVNKIEEPNKTQSNYNHSAEIILLNSQGKIQAYFTYPPNPEKLAAEYMAILSKSKLV